MLILAVHTVTEISATVSFSSIVLTDCVSKKLHPPEFKCRQILPTSGARSSSLWEAPNPDDLRIWLDELLESDCKNETYEVQEQFTVGLFSDLAAARAAEQLGATTRSTAAAATQHFERFDEKFKVSAQATAALEAAKKFGLTAAKNTQQTFNKVSSKAMENEKVATTAQATSQAFKGFGDRISSSFKLVQGSILGQQAADVPQTQQAAGLQSDEPYAAQAKMAPAHSSVAAPDASRAPGTPNTTTTADDSKSASTTSQAPAGSAPSQQQSAITTPAATTATATLTAAGPAAARAADPFSLGDDELDADPDATVMPSAPTAVNTLKPGV